MINYDAIKILHKENLFCATIGQLLSNDGTNLRFNILW